MPVYPYPPQGFDCLYKHACPYLDRLSTKWVFGEYRRGERVYQEHLRIIDLFRNKLEKNDERVRVLERENAELKAKLAALHLRQFKQNKKNEIKAGIDNTAGAEENGNQKKRGAPMGHPGWVRPRPDHIDLTIHVPAPTECPHCHSDALRQMEETAEHIQEDIVIQPRTVVTRYQHEQAFCPRCNRAVVKTGDGEMPNAAIGPVAKSAAVYLRYAMGLSYRKTSTLFKDLFGLKFVPGSAVGFDRKAAERGTKLYDDLREKIRRSDMVHADETSWRNDGVGHFAWYAGNEDIAFFHIDRHRSKKVAEGIFGSDFKGILVRDRYAAYNGIGMDWQSCLAHIIRRAKEIKQEHELLPEKEKGEAIKLFCDGVQNLFKKACKAGNQLLSKNIAWDKAANIEARFIKDLNKICKQQLQFKPAETLRSHLIGSDQKSLFTFLRHQGVPPTNNHAEQSIRHIVIFRKICFGTRSESGLRTHSILPSLVQTAKRQGVKPQGFLQTLLTADAAIAHATLYANSS